MSGRSTETALHCVHSLQGAMELSAACDADDRQLLGGVSKLRFTYLQFPIRFCFSGTLNPHSGPKCWSPVRRRQLELQQSQRLRVKAKEKCFRLKGRKSVSAVLGHQLKKHLSAASDGSADLTEHKGVQQGRDHEGKQFPNQPKNEAMRPNSAKVKQQHSATPKEGFASCFSPQTSDRYFKSLLS